MNLRVFVKTAGRPSNSSVIVSAMFCLLCVVTGWTEAYAEENHADSPNYMTAKLAGDMAGKIQVAAKHLDVISKKGELRQLFIAGDRAALDAQAGALASEFDAALKLRLLIPGQYDVELDANPFLGYASLDLLRKAEKSSTPLPAEIHGHGGPAPHIVIIRRVEDADKKLIGLLHLSLAPETYLQLTGMEGVAGYVEVSQATDNGALLLSSSGKKEFRKGNPIKADITGTRWYITYWAGKASNSGKLSEMALPKMDSPPLVPIMMVMLTIVVAAAGFLFYRRKIAAGGEDEVRTVEADHEVVYAGAVKAIMEGKHPGLEKLIPDLPMMGITKPVQPLSQGLTGEDITLAQGRKLAPPPPAAATAKKPAATAGAPLPQAPTKKTPPPVAAPTAGATPDRLESTVPMPAAPIMNPEPVQPPPQAEAIPSIIFRTYDIRGIVGKTLTVNGVYEIGRAIGSEAEARGLKTIAVGRDGRTSSPELAESLTRGLQATGRNVIDIGMVPTPILYFATHHLKTGSGVMVTGSHNGPAYNGLKIMLGGETLSGEAIQALRTRIETGKMSSGQGTLESAEITADYLRRATEDMPVILGSAFKIVVDCGNGVAGMIAPQLYSALGYDVVELYCEVDGAFPNHHPDPSQPENLQELIAKVHKVQADLGFAFDGDGDRLGVVDSSGNIIWPDRQLMLFAQDVLSRNPGAAIIYDVKCSRHMKSVIEKSGGRPVMWKTGHSLIKSKMKELDAPLAGEMSGHIFFKERWYGFDDALYAGARMLEILGRHNAKTAEVFAELPGGVATPELRIMLAEKHHAQFMQDLRAKTDFKDAEIFDIDGVRVEFRNGWGLIRPSNTTPCLIARFEADDSQALEQIQASFRELIKSVAPDLKLPF
jgi:phosphomannomutase/phosphoglucomutase